MNRVAQAYGARWAGCILVVMACGALAACTTAQGSHAQSSGPSNSAHSAPATAPVPGDGHVHLSDYTNNDSMASTVTLTGAVDDHGNATRDESNGQLDIELSRGSFRLDIGDLDGRFLDLMRHLVVNQHSCSAEATATALAAIVPGSGTGAYSTVSGAFDLSTTLHEVYHPGACRETAPYLAQQIVTSGWGTISRG